MIVAVVVFSVLSFGSRGFFSRYSGFPPLIKTPIIYNFQFDQEAGRRRTILWMYIAVIISTYHNRLVTVLEEIHREKNIAMFQYSIKMLPMTSKLFTPNKDSHRHIAKSSKNIYVKYARINGQ